MVWLSQAPFRAVTAVLAPPAAPPVAVGSPHSTASNSLILASTALGSASSGSKAGALRSWRSGPKHRPVTVHTAFGTRLRCRKEVERYQGAHWKE